MTDEAKAAPATGSSLSESSARIQACDLRSGRLAAILWPEHSHSNKADAKFRRIRTMLQGSWRI
jgi:hypothetical protein